MKDFFKKVWEKIKAWALLTALPWLKKSWMQIVNIIIVFIAYKEFSDLEIFPENIVGLWLFLLLVYYIFWKLFGVEKWFKFTKKNEDKPNPIPIPTPIPTPDNGGGPGSEPDPIPIHNDVIEEVTLLKKKKVARKKK